jgi:hypothetical protein
VLALLLFLVTAARWVAILAASVIGVFVLFTWIAPFMALFLQDAERAERARKIAKGRLNLFRKGSSDLGSGTYSAAAWSPTALPDNVLALLAPLRSISAGQLRD